MVACYSNGASWRRRSGPDQPFDSTLAEALKNAKLPVPPRTHTEVGARRGSSEWTDVCGFVKTAQVSIGLVHAEARRM